MGAGLTTEQVLLAAREAGFANQFPTGQMLEMFERFYATVRNQALEDAARVAEAQHEEDRPSDYAYAIRALKEQQHG